MHPLSIQAVVAAVLNILSAVVRTTKIIIEVAVKPRTTKLVPK